MFVDEDWHEKPPECEGQSFDRDRILFDFTRYKNCTFDRCQFRYASFGGLHLENPKFTDRINMEMTNGAYRTIEFLKELYLTGGAKFRDMINQSLGQIVNQEVDAEQE